MVLEVVACVVKLTGNCLAEAWNPGVTGNYAIMAIVDIFFKFDLLMEYNILNFN